MDSSEQGSGTGTTAETQPPARREAAAEKRRAWRLTWGLSVAAVLAFLAVRSMPLSGGSLHYTDFQMDGMSFLEFCEPGSPQFAPVDQVPSPVTLELSLMDALEVGKTSRIEVRLVTSGGKLISGGDLLVTHTEKLHILIIDATLEDYQHEHPTVESASATEFAFAFTPRRTGRYRVFADFMPRATGRALYAGAELQVAGPMDPAEENGRDASARAASQFEVVDIPVHVTLRPVAPPVRIGVPNEVLLVVSRGDGAPLALQDVMGAPAHVVAFDRPCTGFAHLHPFPVEEGVDAGGNGATRQLRFSIQVGSPGFYRLWAQVKVDDREIFAPVDLDVVP